MTSSTVSSPAVRARQTWPWWRGLVGLVVALLVWTIGDLAYVSLGAETDQAQAADVLIVLGCGASAEDGQASDCIQARAGHAAALYGRGLAPAVIASGGRNEVAALTRVLVAGGVPAEAVLAENHSRDTIQNIRNSQAIMATHGWHNAVLVTEPYHIKRATLIAHDQGLTVYPSPAVASPLWTQPSRRALKLTEDTASLMLYQVKRLFGIQS